MVSREWRGAGRPPPILSLESLWQEYGGRIELFVVSVVIMLLVVVQSPDSAKEAYVGPAEWVFLVVGGALCLRLISSAVHRGRRGRNAAH